MYCDMSLSSTSSARTYAGLPLPPGTSASWIPPSSLYCCHKSASMSSAAASNRRIAASPAVRPPLARAVGALANSPAPMVPAPTASDLPKKERRLMELFEGLTISFISYSPLFGIFFIFLTPPYQQSLEGQQLPVR